MTPAKQLDALMARYPAEVAAVARAALRWMRRKFPHADALVYFHYALAIGFTPGRPSDAVFSVVLYTRWVNLFFLKGAHAYDPNRLLQGTGKQVRTIRLENAKTLADPAVVELIEAEAARLGLEPGSGRGKLIIQSISDKRSPR
jgi:hypothetical protein